jgi:hypothetical protein
VIASKLNFHEAMMARDAGDGAEGEEEEAEVERGRSA